MTLRVRSEVLKQLRALHESGDSSAAYSETPPLTVHHPTHTEGGTAAPLSPPLPAPASLSPLTSSSPTSTSGSESESESESSSSQSGSTSSTGALKRRTRPEEDEKTSSAATRVVMKKFKLEEFLQHCPFMADESWAMEELLRMAPQHPMGWHGTQLPEDIWAPPGSPRCPFATHRMSFAKN